MVERIVFFHPDTSSRINDGAVHSNHSTLVLRGTST
jgi:hypothetical protein